MIDLQASRVDTQPFFEHLVPSYIDYCENVSNRGMAISIETASYFLWTLAQTEAKVVVDLGSGFTSYVARLYADAADYPVEVHSVDDNAFWMTKTTAYLEKWGMPTDGLHLHSEWLDLPVRADVIIHDISAGEVREEWMTYAAQRLNPGGVLIFDDAQHSGHHREMCRVAREFGFTLYDIYDTTVDMVLRHATVARNEGVRVPADPARNPKHNVIEVPNDAQG